MCINLSYMGEKVVEFMYNCIRKLDEGFVYLVFVINLIVWDFVGENKKVDLVSESWIGFFYWVFKIVIFFCKNVKIVVNNLFVCLFW